MALALGKLTVLIGAGLVGSILAKEGRLPTASDFFSGALKIALKPLQQSKKDNSGNSSAKPHNDSLLQQVNSLRQELQLLASSSSQSVTIVTSSGSGSSKYGVVIIVVVVGYGYIWWKGYKLSDMMFATKRGLSDACTGVSKQLESVYSSISATKRHLSSRLDRVDSKIDESMEQTASTREEVSELRGEIKLIGTDVQTVYHAVRTLETNISRIEGRQNETNFGVGHLIAYVKSLENAKPTEQIEAAPSGLSRPALELLPPSPSSKAGSLLTNSSHEASSSSASNGTFKRPLQSAISASGLKELYGISEEGSSQSNPRASNGVHASEAKSSEQRGSGSGSSSGLLRRFTGISASFLSRTQTFK